MYSSFVPTLSSLRCTTTLQSPDPTVKIPLSPEPNPNPSPTSRFPIPARTQSPPRRRLGSSSFPSTPSSSNPVPPHKKQREAAAARRHVLLQPHNVGLLQALLPLLPRPRAGPPPLLPRPPRGLPPPRIVLVPDPPWPPPHHRPLRAPRAAGPDRVGEEHPEDNGGHEAGSCREGAAGAGGRGERAPLLRDTGGGPLQHQRAAADGRHRRAPHHGAPREEGGPRRRHRRPRPLRALQQRRHQEGGKAHRGAQDPRPRLRHHQRGEEGEHLLQAPPLHPRRPIPGRGRHAHHKGGAGHRRRRLLPLRQRGGGQGGAPLHQVRLPHQVRPSHPHPPPAVPQGGDLRHQRHLRRRRRGRAVPADHQGGEADGGEGDGAHPHPVLLPHPAVRAGPSADPGRPPPPLPQQPDPEGAAGVAGQRARRTDVRHEQRHRQRRRAEADALHHLQPAAAGQDHWGDPGDCCRCQRTRMRQVVVVVVVAHAGPPAHAFLWLLLRLPFFSLSLSSSSSLSVLLVGAAAVV
uniref:PHD finger protein 3 n=1 Tax=Anthurium amnicola TaxID=1678845 RepID=A0A1D1YXK8_9ARAE